MFICSVLVAIWRTFCSCFFLLTWSCLRARMEKRSSLGMCEKNTGINLEAEKEERQFLIGVNGRLKKKKRKRNWWNHYSLLTHWLSWKQTYSREHWNLYPTRYAYALSNQFCEMSSLAQSSNIHTSIQSKCMLLLNVVHSRTKGAGGRGRQIFVIIKIICMYCMYNILEIGHKSLAFSSLSPSKIIGRLHDDTKRRTNWA